jgi:hypothetical protein
MRGILCKHLYSPLLVGAQNRGNFVCYPALTIETVTSRVVIKHAEEFKDGGLTFRSCVFTCRV